MLCDRGRRPAGTGAGRECVCRARMEQPTAPDADAVVRDATRLLVAEVVGLVSPSARMPRAQSSSSAATTSSSARPATRRTVSSGECAADRGAAEGPARPARMLAGESRLEQLAHAGRESQPSTPASRYSATKNGITLRLPVQAVDDDVGCSGSGRHLRDGRPVEALEPDGRTEPVTLSLGEDAPRRVPGRRLLRPPRERDQDRFPRSLRARYASTSSDAVSAQWASSISTSAGAGPLVVAPSATARPS